MNLSLDYPPTTRGTVVVWGLLAAYPFGGMTWQVLHHLAGLRRLGFDVWYVEDRDSPLLNPTTLWRSTEFRENLAYLSRYMNALGMGDRWVFRPTRDAELCFGARDRVGLAELYREADAVLNLCGAHYVRADHAEVPCLVYLQTDPVLTQVQVAQGEEWVIGQLDNYDYLFTYGENLGNPDCPVPITRYTWRPTRPPVVTDWWSTKGGFADDSRLTTISTWKDHKKDIEWNGQTYTWRKDLQFRRFLTLPSRSGLPLELALEGIRKQEIEELRSYGWRVVSARDLVDPAVYRDYIRYSLGEFTIAKEQYVLTRTGWFSDRSVCYLAAGRPVITQDTGFGKFVPTGRGLFAFQTMDDILIAIDAVSTDYEGNSCAAREIAVEYFSAERVIGSMMERIGF